MPIDDVNSVLVGFMAKSYFPRANFSFSTTRLPLNDGPGDHGFFEQCFPHGRVLMFPLYDSFIPASDIYHLSIFVLAHCLHGSVAEQGERVVMIDSQIGV